MGHRKDQHKLIRGLGWPWAEPWRSFGSWPGLWTGWTWEIWSEPHFPRVLAGWAWSGSRCSGQVVLGSEAFAELGVVPLLCREEWTQPFRVNQEMFSRVNPGAPLHVGHRRPLTLHLTLGEEGMSVPGPLPNSPCAWMPPPPSFLLGLCSCSLPLLIWLLPGFPVMLLSCKQTPGTSLWIQPTPMLSPSCWTPCPEHALGPCTRKLGTGSWGPLLPL